MIVDIRSLPGGAVVEADLCIIGGGAAAIAMAMQLAGTKRDVAILESGDLTLDEETRLAEHLQAKHA